MTIDRRFGKVIIDCDSEDCQSSIEGDHDEEFSVLWERAKAEGWKARRIAGEWLHACGDCEVPT